MRGEKIPFFLLSFIVSFTTALLHYAPIGPCDSDHICEYNYSVEQNQIIHNGSSTITVIATVQITCESNGTYDSALATRYCMTIKDIDGNFISIGERNIDTNQEIAMKEYIVRQFSGWFCFVQTSDGAVVSVYHSRDEPIERVNFKKSIAATFQSNFLRTKEKIEIDAQSKHISHYSYNDTEDGSIKIHRTIMSEDVMEYPIHASQQDIQVDREENINYRDGILLKSNGTIQVSSKGNILSNASTFSDSNGAADIDLDIFMVHGYFSMELQVCRLVPHATRKRRETNRRNLASGLSCEESLMAGFNESKRDKQMLEDIRKQLTDAVTVLQRLNETSEKKAFSIVEKAMMLEAKYGPPEGYPPLLDYVLSYLKELYKIESEENLIKRISLYSLLSTDGSWRSQAALLRCYKSAVSSREKIALIISVAMISIPTEQFIDDLEAQINLRGNSTDPLLLAYGAVASNAPTNLQKRMVSFLTDQISEVEDNETALVHLIHSIGNTKSLPAMYCIIQYVDSNSEIVQIATITAVRFFTGLVTFQDKLISVLQSDPSEAIVNAVIDALSECFVHDKNMLVKDDLHNILMNVTLNFRNHELESELKNYFEMVGSEKASRLSDNLNDFHQDEAHYRNHRDTTYWPSSNTDYNAIASQSSRQSDVSLYRNYLGYLWNKKFGKTSGYLTAYVDTTVGFFAGVDGHRIENLKVFGKGVVRGHILTSSFDIAKIEALLQKSGQTYTLFIYFKIGGLVLVNEYATYTRQTTQNNVPDLRIPISKRRNLLIQRRVFGWDFPIFVYVGYITFSVSAYASLDVSTTLSVQGYGNGARATLSYSPQVTFSVEGSASFSFLEIARVGASLSLNIPYRISAQGKTTFCVRISPLSFQSNICTGLYDQWPSQYIRAYAWYEARKLSWCGGWIRYPCFIWDGRHTWDALSFTWNFSRSGGWRTLRNTCNRSIYC